LRCVVCKNSIDSAKSVLEGYSDLTARYIMRYNPGYHGRHVEAKVEK